MKEKDILANFLKDKRSVAGLSQRDVADKLGYSTPQFISNWERGISHPPISALKKLSDLYKVSAEELFEMTLDLTIQDVTRDMRRKFANSKAR
jgi:transcriptional regulator with XRE-family HTH domain